MKTVIDLFCGAGGLSEGFRQAGFRVLAGNDFSEIAGATFSKTHDEAEFVSGPIEDVSAKQLLKAASLKKGELDCLVGGPPCQAYSVYNHQRGMHDYRSGLFKEYLRIVEGIRPKWVVLENVTGILSVGKGKAVEAIKKGLEDLGYEVDFRVLKSEEFGVPQMRRRIFFVGNRIGKKFLWPERTHGEGKKPLVTVKDAIWDLPKLENGEEKNDVPYRTVVKNEYQEMLRGNEARVFNHSAPRLSSINIDRMSHIPPGGSWRDVPIDLLPAGMRRAKRSDHTKRYGRLKWDGLSSTILTKCDMHWGAFIHPAQDRCISVREAARFQSFPDWFTFEGSKTDQYIQVGNAVPPLLGKAIAMALKRSNEEKRPISPKEENESLLALA